MEKLTLEDWTKILKDAKMLYRDTLINLAVFENTISTAERKIRNLKKFETFDTEGKLGHNGNQQLKV